MRGSGRTRTSCEGGVTGGLVYPYSPSLKRIRLRVTGGDKVVIAVDLTGKETESFTKSGLERVGREHIKDF